MVPAYAAINDQIHFQGKVVNTDGTNVTNGSYSFTFTVYDASSGGTNLWTETKSITVTDGIFDTDLGSVTDLPGSIDFNSDTLYLAVNFNSDGEMSPRIRLTAVPYAFNAEKVAGLTVTSTTGTLTIPSATIAFSGDNDVTLTSTGATTLTLPTTGTLATLAGSETFSNKTIDSGGLIIASTGWVGLGSSAGKITFTDSGTDTIAFENANVGIGTTTPLGKLNVEGAAVGKALTILNELGDQNIFTASASGTTRFVITNTGNVGIGSSAPAAKLDVQGEIAVNNNFISSADYISISDPGPGEGVLWNSTSANWRIDITPLDRSNADGNLNLHGGANNIALWRPSLWVYDATNYTTATALASGGLNFTSTGTGDITFNPGGNVGIGTTGASSFKLEIAGNIGPEANNTRTLGSDTKRWASVHTTQLCLSGDCQTAWPAGGSGSSNWRYNLGTISVVNDTVDLLVGANASGSAKFAIRNVNNGTPTASISTGLSGTSAFLSADGSLSTTKRTTLTIGNSATYNTTGVVLINPNGTGNVGIGTTNPGAFKLNVSGTGRFSGLLTTTGITNSTTAFTNSAAYTQTGTSANTFTGTSTFSNGTYSALFTGGNVGIGSSSPARLLNVAGAVRLNSTSTPTGAALGDIYTNADGNLYFYNGSTWDDLTGGGASYFAKSGTNLSPTTSGDDLYLGSGELLGVGYDPTALSNAVAAFSGNVGIGTSTATSKLTVVSGDTTEALNVIGDSVTTGEVVDLSADGITTGYALNVSSESNNLTTGGLIDLDWSPTAVATASGDLFKIRVGAHGDLTGNIFALYDDSTSIFLASTTKITSGVPHEFTAAGDVSMAYDLVFTNQTSATIESYGPLTIKSGEVFENLDLTLDPSGTGGVVIADGANIKMYSDQKVIFDVDDSSDTYIDFDSTNNWLEVFTDGSERFRFTASGQNESNGALTTTLSDVAENYPTMNAELTAGDVIMIADQGIDSPATALVDLADTQHREKVLGVVSSKPGLLLGGSSFLSDICEAASASESGKISQREKLLQTEYTQLQYANYQKYSSASSSAELFSRLESSIANDLNTLSTSKIEALLPATTVKTIDDRLNSCDAIQQVPVALAGRIPAKFDNSQGEVKPGDLLSMSPLKPGHVAKVSSAGWIVGRALAPSNSDSETVMMFVNISWYGGESNILSLGKVLGESDVVLSKDVNDLLSTNTSNGKTFLVSSANMSVFGTLTADTLAATNKILTGMLSIGGVSNEITTVNGSSLRLQTGFAAGNIEAFNKKLVFTSSGGVIAEDQITARRYAASGDARGSVYATSNQITVEKNWDVAPTTINLTPEYRADVWVTNISKNGFTINAEPTSANNKIYWWAVW